MAKQKKSRKGEYYRPHPLDFELLRRMPKEGATLGYHQLAMTAKHVLNALNKGQPPEAKLTAENVTSRLVSMKYAGFVVNVALLGAGTPTGWQRTAKGEEHYTRHTGKTLSDEGPDLKLVEGGRS